MGTEILIPSGILCKAIAMVRLIPSVKLLLLVMKVAIPSGILCKMIANIEIIPTLYNVLLLLVMFIF